VTRRPNNTFDDKTNTWLREHADDLKGIEGARHLKPNAESLDEDKKPPVDPPCTVCGRPIFDEFVDPKNSSYCTRPACKRKRAKLEKEQARLAHEKANPDGAAKSAAKAAAKATQRRAAREEKDIEADYDLEDGLGNVRDAVDDARGLEHKVFVEDPMEKDQAERDYKKEFGEDLRTSSTGREVFDDDDDDEFEEGADEEFDKSLEEKPEEVPEGTTTSVTKARPKVAGQKLALRM
jgi:hypothetical protein